MAKRERPADEDFNEDFNEERNEETTSKPMEARVTSSEGKKVRIRATEDIHCLIACIPYDIAKDKEVQVPSDVAAILCFARKAYRL